MELVRIGELAKRSGVPIATLKHYLREGLIAPARKSGRTMSWYDPALATKVRAIKELQQRQFLPLDVIKQSIEGDGEAPDDLAAADAIAKVLAHHGGSRARTRAEILARGEATARELEILAAAGLAVPTASDGKYRGDDLALLSTLGAARRAGISAEMLPFEIINDYLAALRALAAVELRLFREGVVRRAKRGDVARLTTAATELSERLVVLVRRKLLLPTLQQLIEEKPDANEPTDPGTRHGVRRKRIEPRRRRSRRGRSRRRRSRRDS
ncbi:MAG: MerR family transcriptional regulator [Deltaproteobacteria bacterium]|nr:MerR family transcriptional regulator [Deltaproteobacteria bacterium]